MSRLVEKSTAKIKKQTNPWFVSSFATNSIAQNDNQSVVRSHLQPSKNQGIYADLKKSRRNKDELRNTSLWVEKYAPVGQDDLAVNKKKILEVKSWFDNASISRKSPMLLLTGPAGAGKTATIRVIAKQSKFEVKEWTNKLGLAYVSGDQIFNASQLNAFKEFLFRVTKYESNQLFQEVDVKADNKILLLEEFPIAVYKDKTEFHQILRKCKQIGRCPIVFIMTDSTKGAGNEWTLFPADLKSELDITSISFNSIAATGLGKIITRITSEEGISISKSTLEKLIECSQGDIRAAINMVQFTFGKDSKPPKTSTVHRLKSSAKRRKITDNAAGTSVQLMGSRDESLFLFHALGKILHCKRDHSLPPVSLPNHLRDMERNPLLIDPEEIYQRTPVSVNNFVSFLHHNYIEFFKDVDEIARGVDHLSIADCFNSEWMPDSLMDPYIWSISTRGIIHCNRLKTSVGWKPLHKSYQLTAEKMIAVNIENGRKAFQNADYIHLSREDLFTHLIPCLRQIKPSQITPEQNSVINSIGRMQTKGTFRPRSEMLHDKEAIADEEQDKFESPNNLTPKIPQNDYEVYNDIMDEHEATLVIEEFSD